MSQQTTGTGATPTEIKAQAIALHALGYSSRNIEVQLNSMYPSARVPNHATVSRWVRGRKGYRRFLLGAATVHWARVYDRAAEVVEERLDELSRMPVERLLVARQRIAETATTLAQLNSQGR